MEERSMSDYEARLNAALQAVKAGDFSVRLPEDEAGFPVEVAVTFNAFVVQTESLFKELNRIIKEMTFGTLGGQALTEGLSGEWLTLRDNANALEYAMTLRLRKMAEVVTRVVYKDQPIPGMVHTRENPLDEIGFLERTIDTLVEQAGTASN
jgi:hypothetical protein